MRELTAFIFDHRYSVPTLRLNVFVRPGGEATAAGKLLAESEFHFAVELRNGDELVVRANRTANQERAVCGAPGAPGGDAGRPCL